jgi:transcriptional regulator with XRE-family HTH domain
MNYGKEIEKIRLKTGFTQKEVAENNGISRSNYNKIEAGTRKPSLTLFVKIINSMGYDISIKIFKNKSI